MHNDWTRGKKKTSTSTYFHRRSRINIKVINKPQVKNASTNNLIMKTLEAGVDHLIIQSRRYMNLILSRLNTSGFRYGYHHYFVSHNTVDSFSGTQRKNEDKAAAVFLLFSSADVFLLLRGGRRGREGVNGGRMRGSWVCKKGGVGGGTGWVHTSSPHPHLLVIYSYDRCGRDLTSLAFFAVQVLQRVLVSQSRLVCLH